MKKEPIFFIQHITESIGNIESFMKNITKSSFLKNKEKQNEVLREIEIIGEAVKNLPLEFTVKYSHIEWNKIAGARDKIIHHYFGIDINIIWKMIKEDIPTLKENMLSIKKLLNEKKN